MSDESMKLKLPDEVREQFRKAGARGGRKGSREDKIRAGKLGHARMIDAMIQRKQRERAPDVITVASEINPRDIPRSMTAEKLVQSGWKKEDAEKLIAMRDEPGTLTTDQPGPL